MKSKILELWKKTLVIEYFPLNMSILMLFQKLFFGIKLANFSIGQDSIEMFIQALHKEIDLVDHMKRK